MSFDIDSVSFAAAVPGQSSVAAELIYDTDPLLWSCLFGGDVDGARCYLAGEWESETSVYGYKLCTAALFDGELVGIEYGLDRETQAKYSPDTGQRGMPLLREQTADAFEKNCAYLRYLIPTVPGDVYYIQFFSVLSKLRGHGLGTKLLTSAFTRAEKSGYKACQLDVSSDNPAVDFYKKQGMEIVSESRVIPFEKLGLPTHFRMEKAL